MLYFGSDYMEAAHPAILEKIAETNFEHNPGYGTDAHCERAAELIKKACDAPGAEVKFLVGGTQTNALVIGAILRSYQGVIAPDTGHIGVHEAGAVEWGGNKVITLPATDGKIEASQIQKCLSDFFEDANHEHMVEPGMVYISQPTEVGTLYSKAEMEAIHVVCAEYGIPLFVDGARLGYALACPDNDVDLPTLARLADAFYIGGTKVGALFGEAVVLRDKGLIPGFVSIQKQRGAMLAKGWILGIQYETLFEDGLYISIAENAITLARKLREGFLAKGYKLFVDSPTNQQFFVVDNATYDKLSKEVTFSFWEKYDEDHTVIRFVTSWATKESDVDRLLEIV